MFNAMKKIVSFVIVLAAVAMVGCCGNSNKKAAEGAAAAAATEASACATAPRSAIRRLHAAPRRRFDQGLLREIVLREGRGKQVVAG